MIIPNITIKLDQTFKVNVFSERRAASARRRRAETFADEEPRKIESRNLGLSSRRREILQIRFCQPRVETRRQRGQVIFHKHANKVSFSIGT